MPSAFSTLAAQAAAVKARGPRRPGTSARPTPSAPSRASRPLPDFMRGGSALPSGAPSILPQGNVSTLQSAFGMPQHATAELRGGSPFAMTSFGPIVGPRPGQFVGALAGVDGWFDSVIKVAQSVIPKGTVVGNLIGSTTPKGQGLLQQAGIKSPVKTPPPPPTLATQAEQVFQSMAPQNDSQKWMMVGAGVLGLGLIAMIIRRR